MRKKPLDGILLPASRGVKEDGFAILNMRYIVRVARGGSKRNDRHSARTVSTISFASGDHRASKVETLPETAAAKSGLSLAGGGGMGPPSQTRIEATSHVSVWSHTITRFAPRLEVEERMLQIIMRALAPKSRNQTAVAVPHFR